MPAENGTDKGVLSLDKMATTPNVKRKTLKEKIAEPEIYELIRKAEKNKYTHAEIAVALKDKGIEIAPESLGLYLRDIAKERGEVDAKQGAKAKTSKPKSTAGNSEAKADTPKRTEEPKPAASGGKPLGKSANMGGAFSNDV